MKDLKLKIVTPEKILFERRILQVSVSTVLGEITILPNHIPLVSQLIPGEIVVKTDQGEEDLMAVSGGFVEILPDQVVILADTAERAEEIDEERAEAARLRAEEVLKTKVADAEGFAMFTAKIEKELARLKVARKYKKKGLRTGQNN
ncbi:MAG: ATP synthase F1 subunit epsilon [Candidatus Komeilibacteria bacterium RIFOXYC1_FULL_37_11]|uniref:ATP synthase epsilon chain n=1 Tax=Candidatus Komeilibacteria bacterium RIFOXYC1_FULL_37_11 TaxID=1798555 RepID=A0A1G2BWA7_9BACT|nr:MAG: ATP synthase F1 subunit epsilon [Candidatus Komeilibacteria bacterium RIFOXYC1_FULL_37_11]OGY95289.1 MAG: ATP synthase F1 subunit epsilon [Candidatus Komeilibacteria bacterium RIFOXYD1_FULL_37_29]OGY97002.1 MAG: ATP synthase F1 subunit epsilon [Candidatus Komeilibacteria bacterium RIFOXYD2_FULL_37_8]